MAKRLFFVVALVAVMSNARATWAATITFPVSGPDIFSLNVPRFDSSLGTLQSVDIGLLATLPFSVKNTGTTANAFSTADSFSVTYFGMVLADSLSVQNYLLPAGATLPFLLADSSTARLTSGLSPFIGSGVFQFFASPGNVTVSLNAPQGDFTLTIPNFGSLTGYVSYNYSTPSVPEPGTFSVFGLGVLGMGARRWRWRLRR